MAQVAQLIKDLQQIQRQVTAKKPHRLVPDSIKRLDLEIIKVRTIGRLSELFLMPIKTISKLLV